MRELTESYKAGIIDSVPDADLVAYWPALHGKGASLIDRSANANHATITTLAWKRLPCGLYAQSANGTNGYATLTNNATLSLTTKASLEAWLYLGALAGVGKYLSVLGKTTAWRIYVDGDSDNMEAQMYVGGVDKYSTIKVDYPLAAYHHVAVTYDGALANSNIKPYYDGAAGTATNAPGQLDVNANTVRILGASASCLNGVIAFARIWSRVLTAAEISRHYTRERRLLGV